MKRKTKPKNKVIHSERKKSGKNANSFSQNVEKSENT